MGREGMRQEEGLYCYKIEIEEHKVLYWFNVVDMTSLTVRSAHPTILTQEENRNNLIYRVGSIYYLFNYEEQSDKKESLTDKKESLIKTLEEKGYTPPTKNMEEE